MFALKYRRLFRDMVTISKYLKGFHATVERKQVKDLLRGVRKGDCVHSK